MLALTIVGGPFLLAGAEQAGSGSALAPAKKPERFATRSSPIAITHDDKYVWSVNPDNDSVSVFNVTHDESAKIAEIKVGKRKYHVEIDEQGKLVRKQYTGDDDGN